MASGAGVVASGAAGGTTSVDGEELSDALDVLSLLEVEHETLLLAVASVAVLSDDEELAQSVLEEAAVVAAGSVVVGVVCAMVNMGTIPRAATKQPAAAIRAKDVMVNSLSVGGGHKDSTSIRYWASIRRLFVWA